jgi:hypothetical protein
MLSVQSFSLAKDISHSASPGNQQLRKSAELNSGLEHVSFDDPQPSHYVNVVESEGRGYLLEFTKLHAS